MLGFSKNRNLIRGLVCILFLWSSSSVFSFNKWEERKAKKPDGVDLIENFGGQLDTALEFLNEKGEKVKLSQYFNKKKPVILQLGYYSCPSTCNAVMGSMANGFQKMNWKPGGKYEVISISIEPRERPQLAAKKKRNYIRDYKLPTAKTGWHFLTGTEKNIQAVANKIGFKYVWNTEFQEYQHPNVIMILTPKAKISEYLVGLVYRSTDIKMALIKAGQGNIGTPIDRLLSFCYTYDPASGTYVRNASAIMKLCGLVTMLTLGSFLGFFWIKEFKKEKVDIQNNLLTEEKKR